MLTNSKQFNGEYGCIYCEDSGVSRASTPGVRDWPPSSSLARTHDSIKANALEAVTTGIERVSVTSHLFLVSLYMVYHVG